MALGEVADAHVLDQHVGVGHELVDPRRVFRIQHHAALVGVAVHVRERVGWIRALDADHVGAEVGEDAGAEGAAQVGQVDHPQPRERSERLRVWGRHRPHPN